MQDKIKQILKQFENKKFIAYNVGINSTERRNIKAVCETLEGLYKLNSSNLKNGHNFFETIKYTIIDYMKEAGYKYYIDNKNKIKFKKIEKV